MMKNGIPPKPNANFEKWLFESIDLRQASSECFGLLDILYDRYFRQWWQKRMTNLIEDAFNNTYCACHNPPPPFTVEWRGKIDTFCPNCMFKPKPLTPNRRER
jgi:hypothetical protein